MKISDLTIGKILYSCRGVKASYKIIKIQTLETEKHKERYFILECQDCSTRFSRCIIATKFDDRENLRYSHMVESCQGGDDSSEECLKRNNKSWYSHRDIILFTTLKEAKLYDYDQNISFFRAEVERFKRLVEENEKAIRQEQEKIITLKEQE